MKEKLLKFFKALLKNILVFIFGAVLGMATTLIFIKQLLEPLADKDIGLGIIAVAPIMIFFYLIMFGLTGGTIALIYYNVRKYIKKKRKKLKTI